MPNPNSENQYPLRRQLDRNNGLSIEKLESMARRAEYCVKKNAGVMTEVQQHERRLPFYDEENIGPKLMKMGLMGGVFDKCKDSDGWPAYIWVVWRGDVYEEAHQGGGIYSGYPLPPTDPFYEEVKNFWSLCNAGF